MARVYLITTGGTIASTAVEGGDVVSNVSGEALLQGLFDRLEGIEVVVEEFCNVGSFSIDLELAFRLCLHIRSRLDERDCDGVVVTHGTDTMEESAYLADLLYGGEKPIVFTGAQRNAAAPDRDGPRNMANAIRLAASRRARGLGAMIAFEEEFHAARDVTKTHTSRVDTFRSGDHGKLGHIDMGEIFVDRLPTARWSYDPRRIETEIELIKIVMGSSDKLLRMAVGAGARAIVLEGFGRGNATPAVAEAVKELSKSEMPVIVTSRCPEGRVRPIYGNGGGRDLERAGAIFAGDLTGPKARIAAAVLLGQSFRLEQLRAEFQKLGS